MEKQGTKVVHVHLIFERKDFYFGSLSAVFDTLDEERIGIKKSLKQILYLSTIHWFIACLTNYRIHHL